MKYAVTGAGLDLEVEVLDAPGGRYRVRVAPKGEGGKEYDVGWSAALGAAHWLLDWDGRRQAVVVEREGEMLGVTVGIDHVDLRVEPARPLPARRGRQGADLQAVEVRAPMPGLLVALEVGPGQTVAAGATVAVIEAMKMQMELRAPSGGTVRQVRAAAGQEVAAGEVIAVLVPAGEGSSSA